MAWYHSSDYDPSKYKYPENMALTPYINNDRSILLTFELVLQAYSYITGSGTGLRLEVFRTSSLGILVSKLATYSGVQIASVELCIPPGRFQLAFQAYSDLCCVYQGIKLSKLQLTETECAPPTQGSYCEHLFVR